MAASDHDDDLPMLTDALARARRLVTELERTREEALRSPPKDLAPEKLEQGKFALDNALTAAQRTLKALDTAYEIALRDIQNTDESDHANN
jgi:hypothetical protein